MENKQEQLDELKTQIHELAIGLKKAWSEFPEDWKRDDLQYRCRDAAYLWHLIDQGDVLVRQIRKDDAKDEAQKIRLEGHDFDKIEIDGFKFYVEGALVMDEEKNIPF